MSDSSELDELLSEEDLEIEKDTPENIKRTIKVVEKELDTLWNVYWSYAKHLLKFGLAAWVFGLSAFVAALVIYKGPGLVTDAPALSISLLVVAGAVPAVITALLIKKHRDKINRLELIRKKLLSHYEHSLLKKVENDIS